MTVELSEWGGGVMRKDGFANLILKGQINGKSDKEKQRITYLSKWIAEIEIWQYLLRSSTDRKLWAVGIIVYFLRKHSIPFSVQLSHSFTHSLSATSTTTKKMKKKHYSLQTKWNFLSKCWKFFFFFFFLHFHFLTSIFSPRRKWHFLLV